LIDFRADFADDVAAEMSFAGDSGVSDFVADFAGLMPAFVRFTQAAVKQHLDDQGVL
jgi:hypothetical protein